MPKTATDVIALQQEAAGRINRLLELKVDSDVVVALHLMNEILLYPSSPN